MRVFCFLAFASLAAPLLARGDDAKDKKKGEVAAFRELSPKGIKPNRGGSVFKPTVVKNAKELGKLVATEEDSARLQREVDFDKQLLLVFAWGGSGQDRLTVDLGKDGKDDVAMFRYRAGLTRDLRSHIRVYALRSGIVWKVEHAKE